MCSGNNNILMVFLIRVNQKFCEKVSFRQQVRTQPSASMQYVKIHNAMKVHSLYARHTTCFRNCGCREILYLRLGRDKIIVWSGYPTDPSSKRAKSPTQYIFESSGKKLKSWGFMKRHCKKLVAMFSKR